MSNQDEKGRKPDFIAYNVQEGRDGNAYFNKVGAAWRHKDGQGYEVDLHSVPVNGRVTLREMREDRMQDHADQRVERGRDQNPERDQGYGRER